MAGMFESMNGSSFEQINWGVENVEKLPFLKRSELVEGKVYLVKGLYISRDNGYGNNAVAILEQNRVNLNASLLENVKTILADSAMVEAIKNAHMGIKVRSYISKKQKRTCYIVEFVDL